jgi:hemerythrin-like domain-containing protein
MKLTRYFTEEHIIIKEILIILRVLCNNIKAGREIIKEHLEKINELICVYILLYHHIKEEKILLPAIENTGISKHGGIIDAIKVDHYLEKQYIQAMKQSLEKYFGGEPTALSNYISSAEQYMELTKYHIDQEDHLLFMIADIRISNDQYSKLFQEVTKLEKEIVTERDLDRQFTIFNCLKRNYLERMFQINI